MAVGRTLFWLLVSIGITVGATALFWAVFDQPFFFGFLFLPFVFGLGRLFDRRREEETPEIRSCQRCGFAATDPEVRYCPRDGSPLA